MGLDFSRLGKRSAAETSTDPRAIFSALPGRKSKYSYPHAGQSEVWEQWLERRNDPDLLIKMNTGAGKTVVGLLILRSCLNEGVGPVVYLCPDPNLSEQVQREALDLGLAVTDDPGSALFQQSKAILVTTIRRLVNGMSVFGVTGQSRPHIELGTVLVDDVHACLATVEDQFTLRIPYGHDAYAKVFDLFREDLTGQSAPSTQDLADHFGYPALEVPYWAWIDKQSSVLEALQPHRLEDAFKFAWPLISECLQLCRVGIATDEIEMKPAIMPMHRIPSFVGAKRRIYLTATLPDDSILVTHFGARPAPIASPITPKRADDLGDRMILTPLETHPDATEEEVQRLVRSLADGHNVVVIVPSRRRADAWRPIANRVLDKDNIEGGVIELQSGKYVGLVVLINKYDGIDLPGDACRVLVIDGVPEAYSPLERVDAITLADSEALSSRQIQRIEQGMGRGVRSSTDYCVVVLLGARLTQRLNSAGGYARLSPATRAQVALSRQMAEMLHGKPLAALRAVIDQCLTRETTWATASRDALAGVVYDAGGAVAESAIALRQGFDAAEVGKARAAHDLVQAVVDKTEEPKLRGWLKQQAAAFLHRANAVQAQKLQGSAQSDNRALLKPRAGVEYERLQGSADQGARAATYLSARYGNEIDFQLGLEAVIDDLRPDPSAAAVEKFEQAVQDLGWHLGFEAQRPERDNGRGPDVLWKIGDLTFLVIECKSGVETLFIAKNDANQLSGSIDWFGSEYDRTGKAIPLMIHRVSKLHDVARAREGMRVMTFEKLDELRDAVHRFARALASKGAYRDAELVREQLEALGLGGRGFADRWTSEPRS